MAQARGRSWYWYRSRRSWRHQYRLGLGTGVLPFRPFARCSIFAFASYGRPSPTLYPFGRLSSPFSTITYQLPSLTPVHHRASCLFLFGFKLFCLATAPSFSYGCLIFSLSVLSYPLRPSKSTRSLSSSRSPLRGLDHVRGTR
jgi:hypothetical protein